MTELRLANLRAMTVLIVRKSALQYVIAESRTRHHNNDGRHGHYDSTIMEEYCCFTAAIAVSAAFKSNAKPIPRSSGIPRTLSFRLTTWKLLWLRLLGQMT